MDPLSVTASVIALLTLANSIVSVISVAIKDSKSAPSELLRIDQEINSLGSVLRHLQVLLKEENAASEGTQSAASSSADLAATLKACGAIMGEIHRKATYIKALMAGAPFDKIMGQFSWPSTKKDLQELQTRLQYNKSSILMCLQLRSLEMLKTASKSSTETTIYINALLREVQALKAQHQSHPERLPEPNAMQQLNSIIDNGIDWAPLQPIRVTDKAVIAAHLDPETQIDLSGPDIDCQETIQLSSSSNGVSSEVNLHSNLSAWLSTFRATAGSQQPTFPTTAYGRHQTEADES